MNKRFFKSDIFYASMCSVISFVFYLRTLMPGIGDWGDSARFQFFGKTLGISYPTGYPLYILLDNVFSRLPIGPLSYRINLMSAFFASATLFLLFLIIKKLTSNKPLSLISTLLFGFSRLFWQQSLIAEVYTLNTFLLILIIFTLFAWAENKQVKYLFLASFIYGLSLGNHLTMTLLLPAILYFIIITDKKSLMNRKHLFIVFFLFMLGISQYIYVFIRSHAFDAYIEMRVYSIGEFLQVISGGDFREKMFSSSLFLLLSEKLPAYIMSLISQFSIAGYVIGLLGLCIFIRDRLKYAVFFLLIVAVQLLYSLGYKIFDIEVYYIPSYLIFAVFIGIGLNSMSNAIGKKTGTYLSAGVAFILLLSILAFNYSAVDQSRNKGMDLFADSILDTIEDNSVIIAPDFNWAQYYLYKLIGEKRRHGDNIFIMSLWGPNDYLTPYLLYALRGESPPISFTKSPAEKGEPYAIYPYSHASDKLKILNVYMHAENKEILEKEGIPFKRVLNLSYLGFGQELFKFVNKPSDRVVKESSLDLSERKPIKEMVSGSRKIAFRFKDRDYLKHGWDRVEFTDRGIPYCWAVGQTSSLVIPFKKPCDHNLALRVRAPDFKTLYQTMRVYANGNYCAEFELDENWKDYSMMLPGTNLVEGDNLITFKYAHTATKTNTLGDPDPRKLAAAFQSIGIRGAGQRLKP